MNKTNIEYLNFTWSPIAMRCTKISEACDNCWHLRTCDRLKHNPKFPMKIRECYAGDRPPMLVESRLSAPLYRKTPSIIGVQFMGDLFHESISFYMVSRIFNYIHATEHDNGGPGHIFVILTKRPKRMKAFFEMDEWRIALNQNIWLGVTAENQHRANERIPILLEIPANVHFVSGEPLLSYMDLTTWLPQDCRNSSKITKYPKCMCVNYGACGGFQKSAIDWVICGAETGKYSRSMNFKWANSLKTQCLKTETPFFFKIDSDGSRKLDGKLWERFPCTKNRG